MCSDFSFLLFGSHICSTNNFFTLFSLNFVFFLSNLLIKLSTTTKESSMKNYCSIFVKKWKFSSLFDSHLAFNLPNFFFFFCFSPPSLFLFSLQLMLLLKIQFQNSIFFQQCLMLSISLEKITCFISIQFEMESRNGKEREGKKSEGWRCIVKYLLLSTDQLFDNIVYLPFDSLRWIFIEIYFLSF